MQFLSVMQSLFDKFGLRMTRSVYTLPHQRLNLIHTHHINKVLDVGANLGQYAESLRKRGYSGQIISFEPNPWVYDSLRNNCSQDKNFKAFQVACGDQDGETELYIANGHASSSLRKAEHSLTEVFKQATQTNSIAVPLRRLDSLLGESLSREDRLHLKIDTQGFEREVLLGSTNIMDSVCTLELEISLISLYIGQALLPEIFAQTKDLGFVPFWIERGFLDSKTGRMLQIDGLFVKEALLI